MHNNAEYLPSSLINAIFRSIKSKPCFELTMQSEQKNALKNGSIISDEQTKIKTI